MWWMTLKNNRAPLLCYFKLCASFHSHQWIQTGVTVRKCPIWVKIDYFLGRVTLKFDRWPWKTIGHLETWQMTLKNNRAPLLCYFKLCASFRSHQWIQTRVTARKSPIGVKIDDFLSRMTLKFDGWTWKTVGTSPQHHQALCIISSPYVNLNWNYGLETAKLGFDLCDLDLWPLTLTFCMDLTFVIGNNSWKFHDDMMGT